MREYTLHLNLADLAGQAFIELNKNVKNERITKLSLALLEQYGSKICEEWKKRTGDNARMILSKRDTNTFFQEYSEYFKKEDNDSIYVVLNEDIDYEKLIVKFRTYIPLELVKICVDTNDYLKKLYEEEQKEKRPTLYIGIDNLVFSAFYHLNVRDQKGNYYQLDILDKQVTKNKMSYRNLEAYGAKICEEYRKKYRAEAVMVLSGPRTIHFLRNYSEIVEESTDEHSIKVKDGVLIKTLGYYHSLLPINMTEIEKDIYPYLLDLYNNQLNEDKLNEEAPKRVLEKKEK